MVKGLRHLTSHVVAKAVDCPIVVVADFKESLIVWSEGFHSLLISVCKQNNAIIGGSGVGSNSICAMGPIQTRIIYEELCSSNEIDFT